MIRFLHKTKASRFSLIELIITVSVLLMLISLLAPSLQKMVQVSMQLDCSSSNMASIYFGIVNYSDDHNFSLPGPASPPKPEVNNKNVVVNSVLNRMKVSGLQYFLLPYLQTSQTEYGESILNMLCPSNADEELSWHPMKRNSFYVANNLSHVEEVSSLLSSDINGSSVSNNGVEESRKPFGQVEFYRDQDGFHRAGLAPMKMYQLKASEDQGLYDAFRDTGKVWIVPNYPLHYQESINVMYLDGHVETYYPDLIYMAENNLRIDLML